MNRIIARTSEIDTLERKFNSGKSEFVIVYGRRRIGKTFLVNNVFADRLSNLVTALHQPSWAVGLSYHDSHMIHSRVANAEIQVSWICKFGVSKIITASPIPFSRQRLLWSQF